MAPKNNFAVKTGRVFFPAAQTKIRRRLRVRLNWKEILNGDLLFGRVKKIAAATELGRSEARYPLAQSALLERFSSKNSSTDVSLFNLTLHSSCSRFNAK